MLLQPAVENAIEHGDLARVSNGKVIISVEQPDQHQIRVQIQDNGLGREAAKKQYNGRKSHRSLATVIIKERIDLLRKTYHQNIHYRVDYAPGGGTIVTYDFPLKPQS